MGFRRLPSWSQTPGEQDERLLQEDVQPFDRSCLNPDERRRILRAFLRYELLCRVYGPMGTELSWVRGNDHEATEYWEFCLETDSWSGYVQSEEDVFRHWDWKLLSRLEGTMTDTVDLKMLPCMREYVLTLYGAYNAYSKGAKLPARMPVYSTLENAPQLNIDFFPGSGGPLDFIFTLGPPWGTGGRRRCHFWPRRGLTC